MMSPEHLIQDIAVKAGKEVLKKFGKVGVKYTKETPVDVVTEADLIANRLIVRNIKKYFPADGIISEELPEERGKAEHVWIIDPIDGTRNFVKGIPFFCVMIARMRAGVTELAVVYDPVHGELFYAKKGRGAYLNKKKIHASRVKQWEYSSGAVSSRVFEGKYGRVAKMLITEAKRTAPWASAMGSAGLRGVYVAAGRQDWCYSFNPLAWDLAAPALVLKEAGCIVTTPEGKPWKPGDTGIVAGNRYLQPKLLRLVRKALKQ